MPQWERVPESRFDATGKIASMTGNYLRLPMYRVKANAMNGSPGMAASKTTT